MVKLVKSILLRYLPVATVKSYSGTDLTEIPHREREQQVNDLELFVGTEARLLLTSLEEDMAQDKIQLFLWYDNIIFSLFIFLVE